MAIASRLIRAFSVSIALAACSGGGSAPAPSTPPPPPPPPAGGDTNLATLGLSIGELDQQFEPGQTSYTAQVGYLDNTVRIQLQAADPDAVVRVNGATVGTGTSDRIALAEGQNAIEIMVENGSAQKSYSIGLTRETRTTFSESAYMKASNPGIDDYFGTVLALSGDTLVVGAPFEDSGSRGINVDGSNDAAGDSGAAYVLVRDSAGVWSQQAYLKASNTDPHDNFGYAVAISGDVVAIGAPFEASNAVGVNGDQDDNSLLSPGAVYIFVRDPSGQWTQQAYLKPSDTTGSSEFGKSLALDGNTLVIGSPHLSDIIGRAYVFTRDTSGAWSQQAILEASDPRSDAGFGQTLALQGDTLAMGAPFHNGIDELAGAVYIFQRQGTSWSEVVRLKGSNTQPNDNFGLGIALSGNTLAVGAPGEDSNGVGIGADENDNSASGSGAVYIFERDSAGSWSQTAYIKTSNAEAQDLFGYSVALSGDWLAATAWNEAGGSTGMDGALDDNTKPGAGAGYLFVRDLSGNWSQQVYIKPSNTDINDRFGRSSAALSSSTLVFSASSEDSNATGMNGDGSNNTVRDSGAVYVFE